MDNAIVTPPLGLLNLSEETKRAPESRLQNGHDARRLLGACLKEDEGRSRERALTKGLIDGNPPYDEATRSRDRKWECNLNFMEGLSIMDSSAVPYYSLFANVPTYAECSTAHEPTNPDREKWSASITLRFHNLLKRWPEFDWNVQQISYWMRLHGIGPAFFDKEGDWRFRSIESGHLLVPRGAPSSIDKRLPFIIVQMPYRILELYKFIKDEDAAAKAGCDVEAIKRAIMHGMKGLAPSGSNWYSQPWEYFQRILKNNDLTASFTDGDIIPCSWILVQEFNGKISKFLFTNHEVVAGEDPAKQEKDTQFLFADPNCYDSFQEGLVVFFQDTGDGTFHSVRGLAMKAFKHLVVSNRLKCQTVNRAFIDSSIVIQSGTVRNKDKQQLTVWGAVATIPPGGEIRPTTVQGGTQGVLEVDRMLTNHLANNIGMFNQRTLSREDGKGEMPTATQVSQQVAKESTLSGGQITLFYGYLDALYHQIFKRAADPSTSDEEAKRFQKECEEDGVPKEAMKDMEYVRANRQSGYGSPQMGLLKMQQGREVVPMLPEQGKQNWLEDAVTLIYGPEKTERYAPRQHVPDDQDWQVSVENDMIANGRQPVLSSGQDDVVHLVGHLEDVDATLKPIAEAMEAGQRDPEQLGKGVEYIQVMGAHCEEHIGRIEGDATRRGDAKLFREQLSHMVSFSGKLYGAVREAQRDAELAASEEQQATSLSALDQAKIQSVQTGAQAAAMKVASQIENQRVKTMANIAKQEVELRAKLRREAAADNAKRVSAPAELVS